MPSIVKVSIRAAIVLSVLGSVSVHARPTPAQKCEGGKNAAAGKYAACLHKAQQKFVQGGETDTAAYDEAVTLCGTKYSDRWTRLESRGDCPGVESEIQGFVNSCVMSVENALGGGTLGLDPATCTLDLATCTSDLTNCENTVVCGDGVQGPGETCDTGGNTPTCDFNCSAPACGDGVLNTSYTPPGAPGPEQCDDGNVTAGDGCSSLCQLEFCGNGVTEPLNGEQCDDGNSNDLDGCRNNCQLPRCGDGVQSASEVCDTGGNSATCDFDCTAPACGDGVVNKSYTAPGAPGPEQCDDGNVTAGDGCSSLCQLEFCGNGVTEPLNGEQCDDGNSNDLDGCRNNCQLP